MSSAAELDLVGRAVGRACEVKVPPHTEPIEIPEWVAFIGELGILAWFARARLDQPGGLALLAERLVELQAFGPGKTLAWVPAPPRRILQLAKTPRHPTRFFPSQDGPEVLAWLSWRRREGLDIHEHSGLLKARGPIMRALWQG